jgi:hypothetical protein
MAADYQSRVDIIPWGFWETSTGTFARTAANSYLDAGNVSNTSSATNDLIGWEVLLKAGTWTLVTIHENAAATGASTTVKLESTTLGTINMAASTASNVVTTITGVTVSTSGVYTLSYTAADAKVFRLQHITLQRTGA